MAPKTNSFAVLQVDEHLLHAVLFSFVAGELRIEGEHRQAGTWKRDDSTLADALKRFVEEYALSALDVYTVMPRHEIASRFLDFPTHDEAELASMVNFSAAEYVPFPEHELHITQCFVSKQSGGECRALAVYAQKNVIKLHLELLRQAGIVPAGIFLSTSCLAVAVDMAELPEERFALMNIASGGLEALIFEKGKLYFGRAVALSHEIPGGEQLLDGYVRDVAMELQGSLNAYRRETEHGEPVEVVYLCSDVLDTGSLSGILGNETGKDCYPASFGKSLAIGADSLSPIQQLTALGAARLACGHSAYRINLLPGDMARAREMRGLQQSALRVGAVAALLLLALLGLFAQAVYQRSAMIEVLEAQAAQIAPMAEGVASKQRQLNILRQQVEGSGNVLEAMWALTQAVPSQEMTLTQFAYDGESGIDVYGQASTLDAVATFASTLRTMASGQLDYFKNAKSLYENRGKLFDKEIYNFQISIPMKADDAL